jgi:hypothetical protein
MLSYQSRCGILGLIALLAAGALLFVDPIAQDPGYHRFADARRIGGISNFWNVVSNLPFVLVGLYGLHRYGRLAQASSASGYLVMCTGVVLVGCGSAYYHYAPSNASLLWDRLPMTVAFMALLSLLLGERVLRRQPAGLMWILILVGAAAALYWSWTESQGRGDLRPYVLVQFLPVLLIPMMILLFPQRYLSNRLLLASFGLYLLAKMLEHLDAQIFLASGFMGGHAIKHIAAASAVLCIVCAVPTRARDL